MATTFNGREVADNINVDDLARPYKSTNPAFVGKTYHIGRWGKLGFNCSPEFYNAFKAGKVQRLTIEAGTYSRVNAETGATEQVPSATLLTWLTLAQVLSLDENETKLIEGGTKLQVAKAKAEVVVKGAKFTAMKELGLEGDEMRKLLELV
jgi:hypothetical protein